MPITHSIILDIYMYSFSHYFEANINEGRNGPFHETLRLFMETLDV